MSNADSSTGMQREIRTPRAAGMAGLVFAVLFVTSLMLLRPPGDRSVASLARWYSGEALSTLVLVGLYAIPLAGIAFLWFVGVVHNRLGTREDRFFATVFLGSGLLFVAMLFAAAACAVAIAVQVDLLGLAPVSNAQILWFAQALTYAFMYIYAARAAGVFMITTSTIVLRDESMPKWVAFVGYAIAVLLMTSIKYFQYIIMLFPAWVAFVSVVLIVRRGAEDDTDRRAAAAQPRSSA